MNGRRIILYSPMEKEKVMQIDIQSQGFTLTDGIRDHLMKRLACGLSHGDDHITRVNVRLSDINGPRGGRDKRCLIRIPLTIGQEVVVEDLDDDLYVAIDKAAGRCERTLVRRLSRAREHRERRPDFAVVSPAVDSASDQATFH